jgi:hypothetical protein
LDQQNRENLVLMVLMTIKEIKQAILNQLRPDIKLVQKKKYKEWSE